MKACAKITSIMVMALVLLFALTAVSISQDNGQVLVIANKSLDLSSISKDQVQLLFTKKISEINGKTITIVLLRKGGLHEAFVSQLVKKSVAQYDRYWRNALFTGSPPVPVMLETEEEMVGYVNSTKDTIGYAQAVDQGKYSNIQIVTVGN